MICVLLGAALGFFMGERIFPDLHVALGNWFDDIVLGIGGAFLGGVGHELVMAIYRPRRRGPGG
ncbi:MAG: hypothetical protein HYR63_25930 [Proteobacteria bacterium]|nr:hypothetical protein [Pseudomonadota bacterium]